MLYSTYGMGTLHSPTISSAGGMVASSDEQDSVDKWSYFYRCVVLHSGDRTPTLFQSSLALEHVGVYTIPDAGSPIVLLCAFDPNAVHFARRRRQDWERQVV